MRVVLKAKQLERKGKMLRELEKRLIGPKFHTQSIFLSGGGGEGE